MCVATSVPFRCDALQVCLTALEQTVEEAEAGRPTHLTTTVMSPFSPAAALPVGRPKDMEYHGLPLQLALL
jgi:hypothetical protein